MFPAILDLSVLNVAVVGNRSAAARRVHMLHESGARAVRVFSADPGKDLETVAGRWLERRLPCKAEIAALHLLFIANLPDADARRMAGWARKHGTLINTEDVNPLCDFHVPAMVRRGGLLLTVSTGGKSPGLARRLRSELEAKFGSQWAERLDELSEVRNGWRTDGRSPDEVARRTDAVIAGKGWL